MDQKPDSITAPVALAETLRNYAWKARGGGWAGEVTETGWKLFHERLAECAKVLGIGAKREDRCPRWFVVAQQVALGQAWPRESYEKIYSEAVQFAPDYTGPYFSKAYYLLPRWYGKEGELERYVSEVSNQRGGEDGDVLYAWIVWYLHDLQLYRNIFQETGLSWPRVKKGFGVLQERYPESLTVQSELCYLAGHAGDRTLMRDLFTKLEGKMDECVWHEKARFIEHRQWAFSR